MRMKLLRSFFKSWLNLITLTIVFAILLLSLGIYLVRVKIPNANILIILGSFLFYISIIVLAFKI